MADENKTVISSTNPSGAAEMNPTPSQNFCVGAGLSEIAVLTLFSISLWTTHMALSQIGPLEIAVLLLVPLGCGGLAVFFRKRFLEALSTVLNALPL